jgi:hypothetical protein
MRSPPPAASQSSAASRETGAPYRARQAVASAVHPRPGQRQQRTLPPYRQSLVVAVELGFPVRLAHRPDLLDKELAPQSVAQSWRRGPRSCAASAPRRPGLYSGRIPVMPVRQLLSSTHRSGWGEPGTVAPNPHRRLLSQRLHGDLCLQGSVNLPSCLLHHSLRLP